MSSQSETGHYKNVANLKALKTFAAGLGDNYTPQKDTLKLSYLETLVTEVTTLHENVKNQQNTVALAVDNRQLVFENIKPLATKIINTMSATNVNEKTIEDAIKGTANNNTNLVNIPLTKQAEKVLKITYLEAKIFKTDIIQYYHSFGCINLFQNIFTKFSSHAKFGKNSCTYF